MFNLFLYGYFMFISDKIFPFSMILLAFLAGFFAIIILKSGSEKLPVLEKIPRSRLWGTFLGVFVLLWCAMESRPLVSDSFQKYLIPLAIFSTWLGYMFLDYLLARALGGFLILLAHYYLFESFALKTPLNPLFPILCFIMGTFGIFISGKPYLLRNLIRRTLSDRKWKSATIAALAIYTISGFAYGIYHIMATSK